MHPYRVPHGEDSRAPRRVRRVDRESLCLRLVLLSVGAIPVAAAFRAGGERGWAFAFGVVLVGLALAGVRAARG